MTSDLYFRVTIFFSVKQLENGAELFLQRQTESYAAKPTAYQIKEIVTIFAGVAEQQLVSLRQLAFARPYIRVAVTSYLLHAYTN